MPKNKNKSDRFRERYGEWALVAGAAEGLGEAFSQALARMGMNLILADNNTDKLNGTALRISRAMNVQVRQVPLDLSFPEAPASILESMKEPDCRLLVYVAAYSSVKPFLSSSKEELDRYLSVNNRTPLHLVHGFAQKVRATGRSGGIILISSLAGLLGPPLVTPYAATKGFLIRLAESLYTEWKPLEIDVLACCAGLTHTPTYLANTPERTRNKSRAMNPSAVAGYAIRQIGKKAVCIPGWKNRLNFRLLLRLLPHALSLKIMGKTMNRMYLS